MTVRHFAGGLLMAWALALPCPSALGEVGSSVRWTLDLPAAPVDVAATADGQWTFVLLENGELRIYGAAGELQGTLRVGEGAQRIAPSPNGEQVSVAYRGARQLRIFAVEFSYAIDVTGSPFKGPADAPIVIADYSDFQ